ncbi:PREDICTED: meckelin-like [Nanorana parkeri]|uniref:meckelin-like n=1 Tax=Nanorana parkeri TaxID=125878 RepID=UPI0008546BA7|nr:PREDICTED: meckelin-like [Nanorana parkeri]
MLRSALTPLYCLLLLPALCLSQSTSISFVQPGNCSSSQFYNVAKYTCNECQEGIQGSDGLRCVCPSGSAMTGRGSPQVTCTQCSQKKVSLDQRVCLTCNGTACVCGSNDVTEEDYISLTYTCVTCSGDTRPNAAGDRCVLCPPTYNPGCSCPATNQLGGVCVPNDPGSSQMKVTFWESLYLYPSFYVCENYNNFTACQALTNMVIMNAFSATSRAFVLYSSLSANSFLPPLTYSTASQLGSTAPSNLSFLKNAQIQFRLAKYDVRGNFLGWETLKGGTLQMCPNTQSTRDAAFNFGTFYSLTCSLSVSDLFQAVPEPVFYELFLPYTSTSGASMLWPIPVWNANIQGSSGTLGSNALRRFFLIDGISSRQNNLSSQPSFVTVATSLTLSVFLPVSPPSSQPPFQLTVTYQNLSLQASAQVSFAVTYTQSQGTFKRDTDIALGVLGSLAGLIAILETSSWLRRSGQQNIGIMTLEFLHLLVTQLTANIFLIDWERPKDKSAPNSQGKSNVSIWRTVLVANEWNEIQTCRKLSPLFQLFMVLLLLEVVGLKNITAKDLNLDLNPSAGTYRAPWSIILRFGIAASMWLAVGLVQVLFVIFIYERFVEDKIKQFADLCSLSNVSVLVLTHKCYGYYIHGRSVHGQADVSMEMMMDNLRKEEENLCPLRGLEPGSDIQTFEVMLSERVREQYDKIMQPLMEVPRGQKAGNEKNPILQQRIRTYYTVNRFLSAFLDHVYKDLDYVVKNKLFLENVLNIEFQQAIDKSIFYNDDRYHFSRAVFYSNELILLLFDTLLFCIIDLGTQNFILATILTFVIQMLVKILRAQIGRKNLSSQTLVEESFLI